MNFKPSLICCDKKPATRICAAASCSSQSSGMVCNESDCQCLKNHSSCHFFISSQDLLKSMNQKGKGYIAALKLLVEWCQKLIKRVTTQKQEILRMIDEPSLVLCGKEGQFYSKLKKQEFQSITGKQTLNVFYSLSNDSKIDMNDFKLQKINAKCQEQNQQIQLVIGEIKDYCLAKYCNKWEKQQNEQKQNQIPNNKGVGGKLSTVKDQTVLKQVGSLFSVDSTGNSNSFQQSINARNSFFQKQICKPTTVYF